VTTSRVLVAVLCAGAAAAAVGCGGDVSPPRTYPVSGTVLVKGKAVAGVKVSFHAQFGMGTYKFTPFALTDKDGRFAVTTKTMNDGAPAGEYLVTFEKLQAGSDARGQDVEVDVWKGKYADQAKAEKVTVTSGDNVLGPFDLK
jgi:hypothetical protein